MRFATRPLPPPPSLCVFLSVCPWLYRHTLEAKASVPLDGTVARDCQLSKLQDKTPECFEVRALRSSLPPRV